MTNLTGKTPADTYGDLLTLTNNGQGLPEADPSGVEDGKGHSSPLALSQTVVSLNAQTTLPQWTTKTRPQNPLPGSVGLNTDTNTLEVYASGKWFAVTSAEVKA